VLVMQLASGLTQHHRRVLHVVDQLRFGVPHDTGFPSPALHSGTPGPVWAPPRDDF
jgi:hypothetical protein